MHIHIIHYCQCFQRRRQNSRTSGMSRFFFYVIFFLYGLIRLSTSIQVDLYNSKTAVTKFQWTQPKENSQWRESSFTLNQAETVVGFGVCINNNPSETWIRSPYIKRGAAEELSIELKFTMKRCSTCKETFSLLSYEADEDIANNIFPVWQKSSWTMIKQATGTKFWTDDSPNARNQINIERYRIRPKRSGFYLALSEEGSCIFIINVRVFYEMCLQVVEEFAIFPNTTSALSEDTPPKITGKCVPNADLVTKNSYPTMYCSHAGDWYDLQFSCACKKGYTINAPPNYCKQCPVGDYKYELGNTPCISCPANSQSLIEGSSICECRNGYYRSEIDHPNMPCTQPPSEVLQLQIESVDQRQIVLTWLPPAENGKRSDLFYKIECNCGPNADFQPDFVSKQLQDTKVTIKNLDAGVVYNIRIYSMNGVSHLAKNEDKPEPARISVVTKLALPGSPENVKISVRGNKIILRWQAPSVDDKSIELYEVQYRNESDVDRKFQTLTTQWLNATIDNLLYDMQYAFQVRAKTEMGWGGLSPPISVRIGPNVDDNTSGDKSNTPRDRNGNIRSSSSETGIIAGSAVAVFLLLIMLAVMVAICLRRAKQGCNDKSSSDCDALQYCNNGEARYPTLIHSDAFVPPRSVGPPIAFIGTQKTKTYVDPHTYEDPSEAILEFAKEIDVSCITIEEVIGGGEFGDVCKGKLRCSGTERPVAIKTLKADSGEKARLDMLAEASIMGQFDHVNIIFLEGVVTKCNPIMIVTEFMRNGSLDRFLQKNEGSLNILQLIGMMRGVACGMAYLSSTGFIHRDLAARNILVNENLVCKVADFGLSRELEKNRSDYTTNGGKIPVRWTAPEAISYRKFTWASDVWSYGVVMWEILAFGERPYWSWSNQDVIEAIEDGFRLPLTINYCPKFLYELMMDCWRSERNERPNFTEILYRLDTLTRDTRLLQDFLQITPIDIDPDRYISTEKNSIVVDDWLRSMNLERYAILFRNRGYLEIGQVLRLNSDDLLDIGIESAVHRNRILESLHSTNV